LAGAQVASRRKAHHGSSRTVFHEGSGQARGTLTHRQGVEREAGQCYSTTSELAPGPLSTAGPDISSASPGRPVTAWREGLRLRTNPAGRRAVPFTLQLLRVAAARWSDRRPGSSARRLPPPGGADVSRRVTGRRLRGRRRRCRSHAGPSCREPALVDRGSACEAASCTSRSGTRRVCGVISLVIPARRAVARTIRPAPCRCSAQELTSPDTEQSRHRPRVP